MVRAKFTCNMVDPATKTLYMSPVYTGSDENKEFFKHTPGGQLIMYCVNEAALAQFEPGKEYYLDFSPSV